jgi:hypothetical protein
MFHNRLTHQLEGDTKYINIMEMTVADAACSFDICGNMFYQFPGTSDN